MGLTLGKLPPELLGRYLLSMRGRPSRRVVVPPGLGLDFGVVKAGDGYLIVSSDPVTGARERVGWHAVNVSANDVATSGNPPRFMQSVILLPQGARATLVAELSGQMGQAANDLGIAIVGGHTEVTPGLRRPLVVTTAFTTAKRYVTAAGAKQGDSLVMTKWAGLEGTAILGSNPALVGDEGVNREARTLFEKMSVVGEAVNAYRTGVVHAMHDCTEGGVLGAIYEMSAASGVGFKVAEANIPVSNVTRRVCDELKIDPLKLIGSGSLLLAVEKGGEEKVIRAVRRAGSTAAVVGGFTRGARLILRREGASELKTAPADELWRVASRGPDAGAGSGPAWAPPSRLRG